MTDKAKKNALELSRYNHLDALGGVRMKAFVPPPAQPKQTPQKGVIKPSTGTK
jgi:hypothetical protein